MVKEKIEEYRILASRASNIVRRMVLNGELKKLSESYIKCVDCESRARVYDHRDYTKPREVSPVCHSCNAVRGKANYPKMEFIECPECQSQTILTNKDGLRRCRRCCHEWRK